jgi:Mn2+/Fe2+ NRAMP family transporter
MKIDREELVRASQAGGFKKYKTYARLSGPGWLQSAITLGGGSLAGALFLGVIGGYSILWVQLLAMILGVVMLCAISYVTLSTGRSPFEAMRTEVNPVLAWGWLIATLLANLVWALPQYSLAYGAVSQNLFPEVFADGGTGAKFLVSGLIFIVVTAITLCYGRDGVGIKIYEWVLKGIVAGIVLCFMGVVLKISSSSADFNLLIALRGFIPDLSILTEPGDVFLPLLKEIDNAGVREFWSEKIVNIQRERMVGAAATAVGINMTFLLPYSMLSKKWGREHRGLAIFDLSTGMVIPYVLAVSCVVLASAYMFHGQPYDGLLVEEDGQVRLVEDSAGARDFDKLIAGRKGADPEFSELEVGQAETRLAAMLVPRTTGNFANSLSALSGEGSVSQFIFGLGVLAMALSTISILCLISGFVFCEALGVAHGGSVHKAGILTGLFGVFWPVFWDGGSKAYLAVVTSTFGYILFPIACLGFFLMMNSSRLLKEDLPKGGQRLLWNFLLGTSLLITGLAAGHTATTKTLPNSDFPIGTVGLCAFIALIIWGHFRRSKGNESV